MIEYIPHEMCKIGLTKTLSGGKPMNDNQENKNIEENEPDLGLEPEKEPLRKRVAKFSAFIYLGLAIAVVITATVGIFSISYDYEETLSEISFPEVDLDMDEISIPQIVITPEDIEPEEPAGTQESDVEADVQEPSPLPTKKYYSPVDGQIIKGYSMDTLVYSETMKDYRVHTGVDISAEAGEKVVAYTAGTVSAITEDYFYGTTVEITHDMGVVSYYMNLDSELAANIAVGSSVTAGQEIGKVGNTARIESADDTHLHFEMRQNGAVIDPEPLLN